MMRLLRAGKPKFQLRSRERDQATDRLRFKALFDAIETVRRQVTREEEGLRSRYEAAQADASFSMDEAENDGAASDGARKAMGDRLKLLETNIVYYERRIRELKQQAAALDSLLRRARAELGASEGA